jgi:hypothetical protein
MTSPAEIRELEDRRYRATVDVDIATLDELLADELRFHHSSALVDDKASYIAGLRKGKWDYRLVERRNENIDVFGDTARITGEVRLTLRFPDGADRVTESRYLVIWLRRAARWQMLAWQSTRLPASTEVPA